MKISTIALTNTNARHFYATFTGLEGDSVATQEIRECSYTEARDHVRKMMRTLDARDAKLIDPATGRMVAKFHRGKV